MRILWLPLLWVTISYSSSAAIVSPVQIEHALETLQVAGLIDGRYAGQRPASPAMVESWFFQAERNLRSHPPRSMMVARTFRALETLHAFVQSSSGSVFISNNLFLEHYARGQAVRSAPSDNGLSNIDATLVTAASNLENHPNFPQGVRAQSFHDFRRNNWQLSVSSQVPLDLEDPAKVRPFLGRASVAWETSTGGITLGRQPVLWGLGKEGGLFFSNNARALDVAKITFQTGPWPLFIGYFGPSQIQLLFGILDGERAVTNTGLMGWKVSFKTSKNLETAFSHVVMLGGEGAGTNALDYLSEFFFVRIGLNSRNVANHLGGFEARYTLQNFGSIYTELLFEDMYMPLGHNLEKSLGARVGVHYLTLSENSELRAEFAYFAPLVYRHSFYASGYTQQRRLLGHRYGPDSWGFRTVYSKHFERVSFDVSGEFAVFSGDVYDGQIADNEKRMVVKEDKPEESRINLGFDAHYRFSADVTLKASIDIEKIYNFEFQQAESRIQLFSQLGLNYQF